MSLNPEWLLRNKFPNLWVCSFADINYDLIINIRPELKYFINKIRKHNINGHLFMELLIQYKKNPNIEMLIDLGYFNLALNKSLQRLSKNKLKEVIKFIKDNTEINEYTQLKTIFQCLKHSCSLEEFSKLERLNFDRKLLNIVTNANVTSRYYFDYINMVKKVGHDIEDPYWKYPSNLIEFHNRVMEENVILENSKNELKNLKLNEVLKNILKYNCKINGYDVFVSSNYDDYVKVCDSLYQCLIRCDYIQKVIDQKEILVFIWKDDIPVATAEVFYDKRIGQFYGDERNRSNCKPSDEVREVLNQYLDKLVLRKRKVNFNDIKFVQKKQNQKIHLFHFQNHQEQ